MGEELVKVGNGERAMERWAKKNLLDLAAGPDASETRKGLRQELDDLAADLAGPHPSPVERVLADAAAINWFALRTYEARYVGALNSKDGISFASSEHAQRRIDRTHRRLMSTLKTLATVRRLGVPAVQVNLAHQQVNVAGDMRVKKN